MSSFPTTLPDPNQDILSWIHERSANQPASRGYNDYYGDVLRQNGYDPNNLPRQGDPNYNAYQHNEELYRTQANSAYSAAQRQANGSFFTPGQGVSTQQANFLQDLFMGYDLPRIQNAANEQWDRVNTATNNFENSVIRGANDIRNSGSAASSMLLDKSQHVGDDAMRFATAGVAVAQENVRQGRENANNAVQANIAAVNKNLQLMRTGTNPDGSPMTPEQMAATSRQVMYDSQIATGQIRAQYDTQISGLQSAVVAAQDQAAGTATNVAQISSGLASQAATIMQSSQAAAAQFEALGMQDVAKMIAANPQSIVSVSNGLLNMWGVFLGGTPAPKPDNTGAMLGGFGGLLGGIASIARLF